VAAALALVAALLFALAATLQQKGALGGPPISLGSPRSLVGLAAHPVWLAGTAALLVGYVVQAAALDRGRLAIIQPLLVTTVVFALPLGYFLTKQVVGRREVIGAVLVVCGLAVFAYFGRPAGGNENAPWHDWAVAILAITLGCVVALRIGSRGGGGAKAAGFGVASGMLFGLSAALTKPTLDYLHAGIGELFTHWEPYALAIAGVLGFVLQQVSLSTGHLAPSVATVSVANPIVGILLGVLVLDERLHEPPWHVWLACIGLGVALAGAAVISIAREGVSEAAGAELVEPAPA
jgi:drug/metabolite transporter (DMT)-like permease